MNTTTAPATTSLVAASAPRVRPSRLRRLLATTAGVVGVLLAGFAAAPSADAAVPTYGTATICFQTAPGGYWGPYNRTVAIDAVLNGSWTQISTTTPGLNGCMVQALPAGYTWRFRVYYHESFVWYIGQSSAVTVRAGYGYNLGTVYLQTYRG